MLLAEQPVHQRFVQPGPLVLGSKLLKSLTPTADRDRTVSRRSEPRSRTALMGEQPNPWDLLQPQDATIRHRGHSIVPMAQTISSSFRAMVACDGAIDSRSLALRHISSIMRRISRYGVHARLCLYRASRLRDAYSAPSSLSVGIDPCKPVPSLFSTASSPMLRSQTTRRVDSWGR